MAREPVKKMDKPQHRQAKTQAEQKSGIERIVQHYLESNPLVPNAGKTSELELRFGTNPRISKPISKIDYDNVVKQLYACGFTPDTDDGTHMLRIQNEYTNPQTGRELFISMSACQPFLEASLHSAVVFAIYSLVNGGLKYLGAFTKSLFISR